MVPALRPIRILSWNLLHPGSNFLYNVPQKDDSAKQKHLDDFKRWFLRTPRHRDFPDTNDLRFVENPRYNCIQGKYRRGGWEPSWLEKGQLSRSDIKGCSLYATKSSTGWRLQEWTHEKDCMPSGEDVQVAVFRGPNCSYATSVSSESEYSKNRMDLVKTFLLLALSDSKDPNCQLNLHADILCLQEVPEDLHTFLRDTLKGKVHTYFHGERNLLTLVKTQIMDPEGMHEGYFNRMDTASIVAFKLTEEYQQLLTCEWMTVLNYHGKGGDSSEITWETLRSGMEAYGHEGCSVVAGDFNLNIPQDLYSWHLSFSSLMQGPKSIDYMGLFGKDRTKWRLSDVQGDLSPRKCISQVRRKIVPLLEANATLLDDRTIAGFVTENKYPNHVLWESETKDDASSSEFNWRALSDHGPLLAEILLLQDSRERSKSWAHWTRTDWGSTIYKLFLFFRMSQPTSPEQSTSLLEASSTEAGITASMRSLSLKDLPKRRPSRPRRRVQSG